MSAVSLGLLGGFGQSIEMFLITLGLNKCDYQVSGRSLVLFITFALVSELGADLHARLDDDNIMPKHHVSVVFPDCVPVQSDDLSLVINVFDCSMIELHDCAFEINLYVFRRVC